MSVLETSSDEADYLIEVHAYKGDATNSETIDKSKVHVANVVSMACTRADVDVACIPDDRPPASGC